MSTPFCEFLTIPPPAKSAKSTKILPSAAHFLPPPKNRFSLATPTFFRPRKDLVFPPRKRIASARFFLKKTQKSRPPRAAGTAIFYNMDEIFEILCRDRRPRRSTPRFIISYQTLLFSRWNGASFAAFRQRPRFPASFSAR